MGKFRTRVKGKGKRWRKGQSSSSNPETKTNRDAAKSRFFQEHIPGKSNLTSEALQKHDAFVKSEIRKDEESESLESGSIGTFKTFNTFASDWSECSNMSFNKLLKGFNSKSAVHKEMLAVLAAVTEVIKTNGGKETSTEYFAALMTTLQGSENVECITAVLSLLGMGLKTVPESVLRLKFSEVSKTFVDLLGQFATSSNGVILRHLIGCLSVLLRAQDAAVWSNSSTIHAFNSVLSFTIHSKPKVRKAAQHAVSAILKGSRVMEENAPSYHPAAVHAAKFCIHQLESGSSLGGSTTMLHMLVLLKEILGTFPKSQMKQACEGILKAMTLGNVLVLSCGMQALHGLFLSKPPATSLSGELNAQLISALFDYQPAVIDMQPTLAWLAVMQEAYINLARLDLNLWCANLPRFFGVATNLWLAERNEIMSNATLAMEAVLESGMKEACSPDKFKLYKPMIQKVIQSAEAGLKYQYNIAWPYVLHLLGAIFEFTGESSYNILESCLKSLGELRDTEQFSYRNELENAIGRAVKSMGPEKVLSAIPLQITGSEMNYEFRRSWMLPVLKENINGAPLKFFITYFLPIATACRKQAQTAESQVAIHSYSLLQSQIWSLLPSFCHNVPDLQENFKGIAKILGVIITEYKDIRIPVMAALRRLITVNRDNYNENNVNELKKFAKNYLPILFNVYTSKPSGSDEAGQRLAALDTIKVYLTISSPALTKELFDKALEKSDRDDVDEFTRGSILDLLRSLISYQTSQQLNVLLSRIEKSIRDPQSRNQKKSYRLLEELCSNGAEACRVFFKDHLSHIENMLLNSMSSCAPATKGPRMRCLVYLVQNVEKHELSTLKKIIPEAVLCCKDNNEKCRESAFALLILIGEALERSSNNNKAQSLEEYIALLMAGLSGPATLVSATLLALGKIVYEYKDVVSIDLHKLLLDNVCLLVVSANREIVASALSYIKAFTKSVPFTSLGPFVPSIIKSLLAMTEDCKRHFRQKCRDILNRFINKFGFDAVAGLVPTNDVVMHKRLRNLRKINERKKKSLNEDIEDGEEGEDGSGLFILKNRPKTIEEILEESDSDFEDSSNKDSRSTKKKHRTWIHEDANSIVDFMDFGANQKIVASLPTSTNNIVEKLKKKDNDMPFKMSSDGRLIVTDDGSDDEGVGVGRRNARFQEDSDDEMDDTVSRAESVKGTVNRKRKLTDGSNGSEPPLKYQAGGSGIHRPIAKAKHKNFKKGPVGTSGEEYRAKKAKGDIKKKGLPDPYAYVPLSRKLLNKRKKLKHAGQFKNLVRGAGKGAQKGSLIKKKNKRK